MVSFGEAEVLAQLDLDEGGSNDASVQNRKGGGELPEDEALCQYQQVTEGHMCLS